MTLCFALLRKLPVFAWKASDNAIALAFPPPRPLSLSLVGVLLSGNVASLPGVCAVHLAFPDNDSVMCPWGLWEERAGRVPAGGLFIIVLTTPRGFHFLCAGHQSHNNDKRWYLGNAHYFPGRKGSVVRRPVTLKLENMGLSLPPLLAKHLHSSFHFFHLL